MEKSILENSRQTRCEWLDALRAIAIIFVILVHSSSRAPGWWIYNVFIGPVMLPLFFAISGYLFNGRNGNVLSFSIWLLKKRIIPWTFISLIWLKLLFIPIKGWDWWVNQFLDFASGRILWFMPVCIGAEIILFFIVKFIKTPSTICCSMALFTVLGFVINDLQIKELSLISTTFIAMSYFMVGYIIKLNQDRLFKIHVSVPIIGFIVYLILGIVSLVMLPGSYMDVHLNMYQNIPLCFFMIFLGCFSLFNLFYKIKSFPRIIVFCGQNTLVCYGFHGISIGIFSTVLSLVGIEMSGNWLWALCKTAVATAICLIGAIIINIVLPEAVGRKRKQKLRYIFKKS